MLISKSKLSGKRLDSQLIELAGRNWLMSQLLQAGLEVARPERDHGVDLIAYVEQPTFVACPIQVKVSSRSAFIAYDKKYDHISGLLLTYVWHISDSRKTLALAMTCSEARKIAKKMGWTEKPAWKKYGYWRVPSVSDSNKTLWTLLQPHFKAPDTWKPTLIRVSRARPRLVAG